jgi:hypothetical protein
MTGCQVLPGGRVVVRQVKLKKKQRGRRGKVERRPKKAHWRRTETDEADRNDRVPSSMSKGSSVGDVKKKKKDEADRNERDSAKHRAAKHREQCDANLSSGRQEENTGNS